MFPPQPLRGVLMLFLSFVVVSSKLELNRAGVVTREKATTRHLGLWSVGRWEENLLLSENMSLVLIFPDTQSWASKS